MLKAGFAQADVTPPTGTLKIGWIKRIVSDRVLDPLYARAAVLECDGKRLGFVQWDTLCAPSGLVEQVRGQVQQRYGFTGADVMVAATHNHAGPAIVTSGDVPRDETYSSGLVARTVEVFGEALEALQPAEIGIGSAFEFAVAHNRRVVMRDGTVRTHGSFNDPNALCLEGPIDPEVALVAARAPDGRATGALVNFACHPTHHGGETALSAGFPGVLADQMKQWGCPVTLFLNGASGNLHTSDPTCGGADMSMQQAGEALARDVQRIWQRLEFRREVRLGRRAAVVQLPYRRVAAGEAEGNVRGAQRFVDPGAYDRHIPALLEEIRREGALPAEVQVFFLDDVALAAIPAEYFVQNGLRIKEGAWPRHALVVGCANGMIGYVPHRDAFLRGGYETTFCPWSKLAPEAGDLLAECALDLIRQGPPGAV